MERTYNIIISFNGTDEGLFYENVTKYKAESIISELYEDYDEDEFKAFAVKNLDLHPINSYPVRVIEGVHINWPDNM